MNDNPWGTRFGQYINSFWLVSILTATDSRASPRFGVEWGDHGDQNSPKSVLEGGEKYIQTLHCIALQTYISPETQLEEKSTRSAWPKNMESCAQKKKKGPTVHGPIVLLKWKCSGGIRPNGFWQMLSEIDPVIGFQADLWDRGRNNFIFPSLSNIEQPPIFQALKPCWKRVSDPVIWGKKAQPVLAPYVQHFLAPSAGPLGAETFVAWWVLTRVDYDRMGVGMAAGWLSDIFRLRKSGQHKIQTVVAWCFGWTR